MARDQDGRVVAANDQGVGVVARNQHGRVVARDQDGSCGT